MMTFRTIDFFILIVLSNDTYNYQCYSKHGEYSTTHNDEQQRKKRYHLNGSI